MNNARQPELTPEQIISNFSRLEEIVTNTFSGSRLESLKKLLSDMGERIATAPASSKLHYHYCFPGGYVLHVLHVYNIAMELKEVWANYSYFIDYTDEEITLVSLFHDLGKIGDTEEDFYQIQDSSWHLEKRGEAYKINPQIVNMTVPDRSLYILQSYGVELSQREWISIRTHDGIYDEANRHYLAGGYETNALKSHLPLLIHQADLIASRTEYEEWKHDGLKKFFSSTHDFIKPKAKYKKKDTVADVFEKKFQDKDDDFMKDIDSLFETP